jgi:hypothetical protein
MREIGDMANGSVIQGLLGLRSRPFLTGRTRIPNRKSGIRIRPKSPEISPLQISNRKYCAILDLRFFRIPRFLIYGSAIKSPRSILKTCHIRISNRR